jgi:hypothetical protein
VRTDAFRPKLLTRRRAALGRYNAYGTGSGGLCDEMWDTASGGSGSYWCGNNTAGGWAEVDANMVFMPSLKPWSSIRRSD